MNRVFVHRIALPMAVKGVTIPENESGDYIVFINDNLCQTAQREALTHELNHIKKDHFRDIIHVIDAEQEAG